MLAEALRSGKTPPTTGIGARMLCAPDIAFIDTASGSIVLVCRPRSVSKRRPHLSYPTRVSEASIICSFNKLCPRSQAYQAIGSQDNYETVE